MSWLDRCLPKPDGYAHASILRRRAIPKRYSLRIARFDQFLHSFKVSICTSATCSASLFILVQLDSPVSSGCHEGRTLVCYEPRRLVKFCTIPFSSGQLLPRFIILLPNLRSISWFSASLRLDMGDFNPHTTVGSLEGGVIVSNLLFGVVTMQVDVYYRKFPHDRWPLKTLVRNKPTYVPSAEYFLL